MWIRYSFLLIRRCSQISKPRGRYCFFFGIEGRARGHYAATMRALCAHKEARKIRCGLYAPTMRPLCVHKGKTQKTENVLLPPIGPPLAGFGRYVGVRKLCSWATCWADSGPPGGPKTARKIPKTVWKIHLKKSRESLNPFGLNPF